MTMAQLATYPSPNPVNRRIWRELVVINIDRLMQRAGHPEAYSMTVSQFHQASGLVREEIRLWMEENIGPETADGRDGAWKVLPPCYYFKDKNHAFLFKVKWC